MYPFDAYSIRIGPAGVSEITITRDKTIIRHFQTNFIQPTFLANNFLTDRTIKTNNMAIEKVTEAAQFASVIK